MRKDTSHSISVRRDHRPRPRLLLAHGDAEYRDQAQRHFRRLGIEIALASDSDEAHRLACALAPDVAVLDRDLREESGYLTCVKLKVALPNCKVILLGTDEDDGLAEFSGAARLVSLSQGFDALWDEVRSAALPPAC